MSEVRLKLKALGFTTRYRFTAEISRTGQRSGWNQMEETLLLKNVRLCGSNEILSDHIWFDYRKRFKTANLMEGDVISFDARVAKYKKGYRGDRDYFFCTYGTLPPSPTGDYKLVYPTKIQIEQFHSTSDEIKISPINNSEEKGQEMNITEQIIEDGIKKDEAKIAANDNNSNNPTKKWLEEWVEDTTDMATSNNDNLENLPQIEGI